MPKPDNDKSAHDLFPRRGWPSPGLNALLTEFMEMSEAVDAYREDNMLEAQGIHPQDAIPRPTTTQTARALVPGTSYHIRNLLEAGHVLIAPNGTEFLYTADQRFEVIAEDGARVCRGQDWFDMVTRYNEEAEREG